VLPSFVVVLYYAVVKNPIEQKELLGSEKDKKISTPKRFYFLLDVLMSNDVIFASLTHLIPYYLGSYNFVTRAILARTKLRSNNKKQ
jgi:hypothetical protein